VGLSAVIVPVLVGLVFPHPTARPVIPLALMLTFTIVIAMTDGLLFGLLGAASSTVTVWFFNFPYGMSFRLADTEDGVAIAAMGVIAVVTSTLISVLRERDARAAVLAVEQNVAIATMQRALLPERMPDTRGLAVGWHYRTGATPGSPVGGDWVAFIPLEHSSFGFAVGDVVGHGLEAVTAMAEFRYATRVLAATGEDPAAVISRVHATAQLFGRPTFSTCIYGVIDTIQRTLTYTNAGHLPPILVRATRARLLPDRHGPPVGVQHTLEYGSTVVSVQEHDLLAVYTDGLVERRGEGIDEGIARLCARLSSRSLDGDLGTASRQIVDDFVGDMPSDDVALVLLLVKDEPGRRDLRP
jgi:serine phosphatase RsbU (regulator of sigma subunit)